MLSEPTRLFTLLWTLLVLLGWTGWGYLVSRLLPRRYRATDWGLMAALGMAVLVALGGVLNLFALISPFVVVVIVFFGSAVWLVCAIATLDSWKARGAWTRARVAPARLIYLSAIVVLFSLGLFRLIQILISPVGFN